MAAGLGESQEHTISCGSSARNAANLDHDGDMPLRRNSSARVARAGSRGGDAPHEVTGALSRSLAASFQQRTDVASGYTRLLSQTTVLPHQPYLLVRGVPDCR